MLPYYIRGHIFCAVPRGTSGQRYYGISVDGLHVEQRVTGRPLRRDEQKGKEKKGKEKKRQSCSRSACCYLSLLLAIRIQKEAIALSAEI